MSETTIGTRTLFRTFNIIAIEMGLGEGLLVDMAVSVR